VEIKKNCTKTTKAEKNASKANNKLIKEKPVRSKRSLFFNEISGFILGAICVWIFMNVLVINDIKNTSQQERNAVQESYDKVKKELDETVLQKGEEIESLKQQVDLLAQENKTLNEQLEKSEKIQKVQQVSMLYNNNSKEEAADLILELEKEELPQEVKPIYEAQRQKILPELASKYHYEAINKFYSASYEEAKTLFEKSLSYSKTETTSVIAMYHLGRCAEILGDKPYAKA